MNRITFWKAPIPFSFLAKRLTPSSSLNLVILNNFSNSLPFNTQISSSLKMDITGANVNLKLFKEKYPEKEIVSLSAVTNEGFDDLMRLFTYLKNNTIASIIIL